MLKADDLTAHFHSKIPISQQMGLRVTEISVDRAQVTVPLAPNINHVQTAFGGSLYSTGALACYALFQAIADQAGGLSDELVISQGQIKYLAPVTRDFVAVAVLSDPTAATGFIESLRRHGKARLQIKAEIFNQAAMSSPAAIFEGTYVYRGPRTAT